MHQDTRRIVTAEELRGMPAGEAGEYRQLDRRLSRKAARALAQGRRFPDPEKDKALHAEHLRLRARGREARRARQRREKQARKRARRGR